MNATTELFKSKTSQVVNLRHFIISLIILVGYFANQVQILNGIYSVLTDLSQFISIPNINIKLWALFLVLLYPIYTMWRMLVVHNQEYVFSSERLIMTSGVLNKKSEFLELYRIKDYTIARSLLERLCGLCSIFIISTDRTNPSLNISYIKNFSNSEVTFRDAIDVSTASGRGRELDVV